MEINLSTPLKAGIKKFVYICSPFKGNRKKNIENAMIYSRYVYKCGHIPICVHIYLEQATGMDEDKGDRNELLSLGKEFIRVCDEVWIFGNKLSKGMIGEIRFACEIDKKVKRIGEINGLGI